MTTEHRSRPRTNLHVALFLLAEGTTTLIETQTENVSMNGFFFYTSRLYPPGKRFRFLLRLSPNLTESQSARSVYLDGIAEVVHVKVGRSGPGFGLGCRVDGYRVLPQSDFERQQDIAALLAEPYQAAIGTEPELPISLKDAALG